MALHQEVPLDELDSDEDDGDYMPSGEESEEEITSAVEDDAADSSPQKGKKRKGKTDRNRSGKRFGGINLDVDEKRTRDDDGSPKADDSVPRDEESQKKRADSLWADFLTDVTPPTKKEMPPRILKPAENSLKKTTVTQVYQFAGEEVEVTKEVDVKSKSDVLFPASSVCGEIKIQTAEVKLEDTSRSPVVSELRQTGLGSVLGKIMGTKNKLSTLEKSKLDWERFKTENMISEQIDQHNRGKDGYLERLAFLQRTDLRQFEQEKNLRLKSRNSKI